MLRDKTNQEGFWWLPDQAESKWPGKFEYDSTEGMTLTLYEFDVKPRHRKPDRGIPLIYGITDKGERISVVECFDNGWSWSSGGVCRQSLRPRQAFIGIHLPAPVNERLFRAAYVELALAAKWLRNSGIEVKHTETHGEVDIEYREPEPIELNVNGKFRLSIRRYLSSIPFGWFERDRLKLRERVSIGIRPQNAQPLDFFVDAIYALRDFLTIVCDTACPIHDISMESNFFDEAYKDKEIYVSSNLVLSQSIYEKSARNPDSRDFLFVYPDVKDRLSLIVNNWFAAYEEIKIVKDLYIAALYSPSNFIETRFLSLAQAIEVYHRRFRGGEYLTHEEFESRVSQPFAKAIAEDLDPAYRDVLRQRIGYLNEYSLSKRLKDISNEFGGILKKFYGDVDGTVRRVVEARNYLTHYARPVIEDNFFINVMKCTDFLKLMLDVCFLSELGFEKHEIEALIGKNHVYQNRFRYVEPV